MKIYSCVFLFSETIYKKFKLYLKNCKKNEINLVKEFLSEAIIKRNFSERWYFMIVRLQEDENGVEMDNVKIKLGWRVPGNPSGMWFANFFEQNVVECNAYMLMCQDSSMIDDEDVISYCNPEHDSKSVRYLGKCLNERGKVSELMSINLEKVPLKYDSIVFMADIDRTSDLNQHFGMIKDAYIQIIEGSSNQKFCQYDLTEEYDGVISLVFGIMFRNDEGWKFMALGEGSREEFGYMIKQIRDFELSNAIAL